MGSMGDGFEGVFAGFENAIQSPATQGRGRPLARSFARPGQLPGWIDIRPSALKKHLSIVWSYDYGVAGRR